MNIFINTISKNSVFILFNENREVISSSEFSIHGNESSKLIQMLDEFLAQQKVGYTDIDNIVIVNGPGSFTGIRTAVLGANSINYIIDKHITSLTFFDLYNNFPIIKASSKRDAFIKKSANDETIIMKNEDIQTYLNTNNIQTIYGEFTGENINVFEKIDYSSIIKKIQFSDKKIIQPYYLKKPNIC